MRHVFALVIVIAAAFAAQAQEAWQSLLSESESGFVIEGARKVDAPQALELMQAGATFVDVRRSTQYSLAHIPGAINLDVNSALTEQSLAEHATKDQILVFYCSDVGCDRSARASAMAVSWGYTDVIYYAQGWSVWIANDYPRD